MAEPIEPIATSHNFSYWKKHKRGWRRKKIPLKKCKLQGYRLELRLALYLFLSRMLFILFTFFTLGIETLLISFICTINELDMTPNSVCVKQNLQSVKMGLCPYVLFFEPVKVRFWPKFNNFQNFSKSKQNF